MPINSNIELSKLINNTSKIFKFKLKLYLNNKITNNDKTEAIILSLSEQEVISGL